MFMSKNNWKRGGSFLLEDLTVSDIFTPEDFDDEQLLIGQVTEDFVKKEVVPNVDKMENHNFDVSVRLLKEAGDLGLLGVDVDEEYGGLGLDKVTSALIAEKMSLGGGFSVSFGAHVGIGTLPIVLFGKAEQKQKYLPDLALGNKLAAYALTEPGAGSDALGIKTSAKLSDDGKYYILTGEKQWITNSGFADVFVVYAKIDGDKFTAFILERMYAGVSFGQEEKKLGIKSSSTRTLILDNVLVPVENVLGEIGKGHHIAFNILNIGRLKLAVGAVGAAKQALKISKQYAEERKQFGVPIEKFNLIKNKLASMTVKLFSSESVAYRTVGLLDERLECLSKDDNVTKAVAEYAIECSLAKIYCSEVLDFIVDEGVQIHGGYGYMSEYEIERLYRDSRINRIFEGTNEINRLLAAGTLLKKSLKGELELFDIAEKLQLEILSLGLADDDESFLAEQKKLVKNMKKICVLATGLAAQTFGKKVDKEQEVMAIISDLMTLTYASESVLLRTEKNPDDFKILCAKIVIEEAVVEIEVLARQLLNHTSDGDTLKLLNSSLRKLTRRETVNLIKLKRELLK
jgi:alkylation response protein AidB-like acyl-CoA dehydrogenase